MQLQLFIHRDENDYSIKIPVVPHRSAACARRGCGVWQKICRACGGSAQQPRRCACGKRQQWCSIHGGRSVCQHGRQQRICAVCSPTGNTWHRVRSATRRVFASMGTVKGSSTMSVVGCSRAELHAHIIRKMRKWNEQHAEKMHSGNIHIDHIKPVSSQLGDCTVAELSHYTNLQPLLAHDNGRKRDRWGHVDDRWWKQNISGIALHDEVYWPVACPPLQADGCEWAALYVLADACEGTVKTRTIANEYM